MSTKKLTGNASVFDQIKSGLEDSIAFSKGKLSLVTVNPPACVGRS